MIEYECRMKKIVLCALFFPYLFPAGLFGQVAAPLPLDSAVNNLIAQNLVFPQEKIYLQTDKPCYIPGEKIFFRAFLLDASLHQPVVMSRYVYVELLHPPADSVLLRVQIRPHNKLFSGYIPIPDDLEQGHYLLRAYTRFMTNTAEDFFFTRPVFIADPRQDKAKPENKDAKLQNKTIQPASHDFDVSFYPEGGHIIAGQAACVAFKALASSGESLTVAGELYDSNNHLITEFSTFHDGMGLFCFQPQAGEHYHSVCYYENRPLTVHLPEVKSNTVSLKTSWRQNQLWIQVNKPDPFTLPPLYLVIHTRGHLVYAGEWDAENEALVIDKTDFPSGVSHVLLLSEDYSPVSERLVFALNDDQLDVAIASDRETYSKREKVQVDFTAIRQRLPGQTLTDSLSGNFAVSVIDDNDIQADSASTIVSSILLTSDLKGYIHHPAYYLRKNDKNAGLAADLLMMTQGWTRYDIPKALRGDFQMPETLPEQSQVISGTVKSGLLSKPYAGAKLTIVSSDRSFFEMGEAEDNGRFSYPVEFPDSTAYLIKALSRKEEKGTIELFVNEPVYPGINPNLYAPTAKERDEKAIQDYIAKADARYVQENGIRPIDLPEVVVKGKQPEIKYQSSFTSEISNVYRITEEELGKMSTKNIQNILTRLPGAWVTENSISVRGAGPPLVLIDGIPANWGMDESQTMEMLRTINVYDIGQIDFVKGAPTVVYGQEGGNGVIEIFTKTGDFKPDTKVYPNIKMLFPLGYQQPVEFYSPKYDTPEAKANEAPDLRSVIYWKPDVLIDSAGKAGFEFYTADSPSTYTVVIEGVSDEGKLIYCRADRLILVE